jgi:solute:Na+ symporter, SSS family
MNPLDLAVIFIYLAFVFYIAHLSRTPKGTKIDESSFYLANNSLTQKDSLFSIIGTEVSALTFLAVPAFAFVKDLSFMQIYLGTFISRFLIAFLVIPKVFQKGVTLYEVMSRNSTTGSRKFLSLTYMISKILTVGVRLYTGSIMVSEFMKLDIYSSIFLTCAITYIYTMMGGLKASVKADFFQIILLVFGGLFAHYYIAELLPNHNWWDLVSIAQEQGKLSIAADYKSFFIGFFGGIVFDLATHGTDQDYAQRFMANRSLKEAKRAMLLSSIFSNFIGFSFLLLGSVLWSYFFLQPSAGEIIPKTVFAQFIMDHFPSPLKGLMVACVLAGTMSTLDTTINALASCLSHDLFPKRLSSNPKKYFYIDSLIVTLLMVVVSFFAIRSQGLLELGLEIASYTGGSITAYFFYTLYAKKSLNLFKVASSLIISASSLIILVNIYGSPWQLNAFFGLVISYLILTICDLFNSKTKPV